VLPALEALDAARGGDKALRSVIKHLARNAPKAKPAKKAKAPEPVAPGLPVWFAPPPLPDPATGDAALDALLAAMPHPDAAKSLAARRDGRAAEAVRARFAVAADGVCATTPGTSRRWPRCPRPSRPARRAHTALYGPMNERLALLRALAADLARRHDPAGDAALAAVAEGHRWVHVRAVVVAAAVAAEPSHALAERLAAGFEAATDHDLALAMAETVLALGDAVALVRFGAVLGTSRRLLAEAAMTALARHLTRRADRAWTALVVADLRAARHPFVHFHALGALADPAAVEAIGDAMTPLLKHGAGLAEAVQALRQMGDPPRRGRDVHEARGRGQLRRLQRVLPTLARRADALHLRGLRAGQRDAGAGPGEQVPRALRLRRDAPRQARARHRLRLGRQPGVPQRRPRTKRPTASPSRRPSSTSSTPARSPASRSGSRTTGTSQPKEKYDALISIEMIDHLCSPAQANQGLAVEIYREYFKKCASWVKPGSCFGFQAILRNRVPRVRQTSPT
jgi:hypothetical protein